MNWKEATATLAGVAFVMLLFVGAVLRDGVVAGVVYLLLFGLAFGALPIVIGIFGSATPNVVAKLQVILGAFAFGHHYLVQRENRWDWCPGGRDYVYVDGEKHPIEGGLENKSVLGWRPFGILRYKEDDTLIEARSDPHAEAKRDTSTDGGAVERADIQSVAPPAQISGEDGTWVVDLKRLYDRGVRKMADMEILERAEEVIERKQVEDGGLSGGNSVLELFGSLLLGIVTAYIYLALLA